jgi:putative addiction module killer protein
MLTVRSTRIFRDWLSGLRDRQAANRIVDRIVRAQGGNLGDVKALGESVSEMRIDHGPGYRVYFTKRGTTIIILLCGGDKSTQSRDITDAKRLAKEWRE